MYMWDHEVLNMKQFMSGSNPMVQNILEKWLKIVILKEEKHQLSLDVSVRSELCQICYLKIMVIMMYEFQQSTLI